MSISLSRYVNINSQVGGQNLLTTRDLLGRLFTGNPLVPPQSFIQFSNPADVGTYFGTTSEEYYRALFYFTWINKNFESPDQIQFARIALAAVAPRVYPFANTASISAIGAWAALTSASLIITLGGVSELFTIDFATAITGGPVASYADVATAITEALVAQGSGAAFTSAVVTYVASGQNPGFHFVGGATGAATISISPGTTGQDITGASWLAWYPGETYFLNNLFTQTAYATNAIWANGSNAETTTACLTASADYSNNFGSFLFLNNLGLTLGQINAAALWNQTQNVEFLYTIPVLPANVANWTNPTFTNNLSDIAGCCLTVTSPTFSLVGTLTDSSVSVTNLMNVVGLVPGMPISDGGVNIPAGTYIATISGTTSITMTAAATGAATETLTFTPLQYPEMAPMMIEAATNYANPNSVQNYMFQLFPGLSPSVTTDALANAYDEVSVNYYGQTQTAGTQLSFYQRGLLQGPPTAPLDMTTYVNELWLKDALQVALMNLLLSLNQLPANSQGQAIALLTIQNVINQALINGTISVGKTLTASQISYIGGVTNDPNAWYQVQNSGYWVDCVISIIPASSPPQYQAAYTLVYSKDDTIRFVSGQDILI